MCARAKQRYGAGIFPFLSRTDERRPFCQVRVFKKTRGSAQSYFLIIVVVLFSHLTTTTTTHTHISPIRPHTQHLHCITAKVVSRLSTSIYKSPTTIMSVSNTSEVPLLAGGFITLDMVTAPVNTLNRRTKIVCTIGPASWSEENLGKLMDAGMNVARFNFSHGDHEGHGQVLDRLRKVAIAKRRNIAGTRFFVYCLFAC